MPAPAPTNHAALDQVAPGGTINLSDAPASLDDSTFDSLFPAEPTSVAIAPAQEPAPASTGNPSQTTQHTTAPFLKGTTSIYNSPEAAVEGINQKDALIENLRQRYALTTGIDPITGQPVAASQPQVQQGVDYFNSPDKYMDSLYSAAKAGDPNAYRDVQAKFMLDTLKPLQPILQRAAREQAVETVSKVIPEAGTFIGTPQYQQTLDSMPQLRDAIQSSERDYRFHDRLPGLYEIAYRAGQGRQLPELLAAQAQNQTKNPPAPPRPTAQTPTPAPPTQQAVRPSFKTAEGIKAYIADAEARGAKLDF